jgi:ribonuclease Z
MLKLHLLGTGAAVSDGSRTTTMLAIEDPEATFVIDCGGDAIQRACAHGIDPASIRSLLLTHEHVDHVSGFPLLMERLWLSERTVPLPVYGPASALDQARRCFDTFDTSGWDGLFELEWHEIELRENVQVIDTEDWSVQAAPGDHGSTDVVGFRFVYKPGGKVIAYSADTRPTDTITRLARDADILVHEATGHPNHSTPVEAGRIANRAKAEQLVLVHLPPEVTEDHLHEVREEFDGPAALGHDGDSYAV